MSWWKGVPWQRVLRVNQTRDQLHLSRRAVAGERMVGVGFLSATSGVSHPGEFTRAIKRPLGAATPSKLRDGMLMPFCSRGNSRAGMTTDPSIHVDPRIKESTSCKTANRYYEEKRREKGGGGWMMVWALYRSRHPRAMLYSVTHSPWPSFFFLFLSSSSAKGTKRTGECEDQTNRDKSHDIYR